MPERTFKNRDESIVLSINSQGTEAYLLLKEEGIFYSEQDIIDLLQQAGVKEGFAEAKEEREQTGLACSIGKPFLIAKGKSVKLPLPEYKLNTEDRPLPYDSMVTEHFAKRELIGKRFRIAQNEVIGRLNIVNSISEGTSVYGTPIFAGSDENAPFYCGENVGYSAQTKEFYSLISGFLYLDDENRLAVTDTLRLAESLDLNGERIDFPGSLIIKGSLIGSDRSIIRGQLRVTGDIVSSKLFVEESATIKGSIHKSDLLVMNKLEATTAKDSRLCSGSELFILESAVNSLLIAEKMVCNDRDESILENCNVYAGQRIEVHSFSSNPPLKSNLTIGVSPFKRELYSYFSALIEIDDTKGFSLPEKLKKLEEEILNFSATGEIKIVVTGQISAGTVIRIHNNQLELSEAMSRVVYQLEGNDISVVKNLGRDS